MTSSIADEMGCGNVRFRIWAAIASSMQVLSGGQDLAQAFWTQPQIFCKRFGSFCRDHGKSTVKAQAALTLKSVVTQLGKWVFQG
jgi:hypothetical protein